MDVAMQLIGTDGSGLELLIDGYQFPDISPHADVTDRNWLMVRLDVKTSDERWSTRTPCLLVDEGHELVEWLERAATPPEDPGTLGFLEPVLQFSFTQRHDELATVRVELNLEALPPSMHQKGFASYRDGGFAIDITLPEAAMRQAARDLESQLKATPRR